MKSLLGVALATLALAGVAGCFDRDVYRGSDEDGGRPTDRDAGGGERPDARSPDPPDAGVVSVTLPSGAVTGIYEMDPEFFDAVLDTERQQLFLSYRLDGVVHLLDLTSGATSVLTTGWYAEFMHFDAVRDEVVIALPAMDHSAVWWETEQYGYVGMIDAVMPEDPTPFWIPCDPWQIVSDGAGHAFAGSGSGQWTNVVSVNLDTESSSVFGTIRHKTNIRIHPSMTRIYGADNGVSPSDIERWDISGGIALPGPDSPYHGDYAMCGDLRIHPDGDAIYTRCGNLFQATGGMGDMTWTATMGLTWDDLVFHPDGSRAYALSADSFALYVYDTDPLSVVSIEPFTAQRVLAGPDYLVLLRYLADDPRRTEVRVVAYTDLP